MIILPASPQAFVFHSYVARRKIASAATNELENVEREYGKDQSCYEKCYSQVFCEFLDTCP
jgi:hypothetical protein